jgi:hypothetical protein
MPSLMRLDKGTETRHAFLRRNHGDMDACDTVLYGPFTSNQVNILYCFYEIYTAYIVCCMC